MCRHIQLLNVLSMYCRASCSLKVMVHKDHKREQNRIIWFWITVSWFDTVCQFLNLTKKKRSASLWPDTTSDTRGWWVTSRLFGRIEIGGGGGHSAPQCLTCNLMPDRCQYSYAYFSSDASFYRVDCYGQLNTPVKSSEVNDSVVELKSFNSHFEDTTCSQEFCNYFLFFCIFLSLPGPGFPLFTLMDSSGSGVGLHSPDVFICGHSKSFSVFFLF